MSNVRVWCKKRCCCCCACEDEENDDAKPSKKQFSGQTNPNTVDLGDELPRISHVMQNYALNKGNESGNNLPSRDNSVRITQFVDVVNNRDLVDTKKPPNVADSEARINVDAERRHSTASGKRYSEGNGNKDGKLRARTSDAEQRRTSDAIDRELRKHKSAILNRSVVLLLGTGESGKSTFLKQLRIIHNQQFTDAELDTFRTTILNNAFFGLVTLLTAVELFGANLSSDNSAHGDKLKQVASELRSTKQPVTPAIFTGLADSLESLWKDAAVQAAYARRSEFHIGENVRYFLRHVRRIASVEYRPTDEDVLYARKPTKTVTELPIEINHRRFIFVDVGGQRVERSKWCRVFNDSLTCILFLVASSEFDQSLLEESSVNRLVEATNVFETVVNNRTFAAVSIVMFFNKTDVLEEKVTLGLAARLSEKFAKFTGDGRSLADVKQFLVSLFQQGVHDANRPFYHHFTTAVDTKNIQLVFRSVKDILLEKNIDSFMLH